MFGFSELISLAISAFIILPLVTLLREVGYIIVGLLFGAHNPRLTIGSGQRVFKFGIFDIRKHYHLYSWFSFDYLSRNSRTAYTLVYASPILINLSFALTINALLANGMLQDFRTFWERLVFYSFYYILFDTIPMITINGKPNNGMIIYEMIRYGRRTDYNIEPFIPKTTDVDEQYVAEMKIIEDVKNGVIDKEE